MLQNKAGSTLELSDVLLPNLHTFILYGNIVLEENSQQLPTKDATVY